jgi:hypothetical protein
MLKGVDARSAADQTHHGIETEDKVLNPTALLGASLLMAFTSITAHASYDTQACVSYLSIINGCGSPGVTDIGILDQQQTLGADSNARGRVNGSLPFWDQTADGQIDVSSRGYSASISTIGGKNSWIGARGSAHDRITVYDSSIPLGSELWLDFTLNFSATFSKSWDGIDVAENNYFENSADYFFGIDGRMGTALVETFHQDSVESVLNRTAWFGVLWENGKPFSVSSAMDIFSSSSFGWQVSTSAHGVTYLTGLSDTAIVSSDSGFNYLPVPEAGSMAMTLFGLIPVAYRLTRRRIESLRAPPCW